jgi:hypothetical protein
MIGRAARKDCGLLSLLPYPFEDDMKLTATLALLLAGTVADAKPLPVPKVLGPGGSCSHVRTSSEPFC